jgi:hypothetical protein
MDLQHEISELEELLITAIKNSDVDRLQQLLDKESDLTPHRNGDLVISQIEISEQSIRIFDDVAVVVVKKHMTGAYCKEPFESKVRFTRIWKRFNAGWKVISASSIPVL